MTRGSDFSREAVALGSCALNIKIYCNSFAAKAAPTKPGNSWDFSREAVALGSWALNIKIYRNSFAAKAAPTKPGNS